MAKRHANNEGSLESMFLRLEELVLANSGEDEFEEVFKLLIAKLWSEHSGQADRFRIYDDDSQTFDEIVALLNEATRAWPGVLEGNTRPALTAEHLHVCVDALARHTIADAGFEVIDGFFEFMVSRAAKGSKGQYFTPRYVIELCVRMLEPAKHESVLDPACGSGGFLFHSLKHVRESSQLDSSAVKNYCKTNLWGFDIDPRAVRVAKALMVLAGDGRSNILRLNSLLTPQMGRLDSEDQDVIGALTLEDLTRARRRRHKGFDVVLTNPPFAGEVLERQVLDGYQVSKGKPRIERDVLFIERCVELLRPGGRMAMVLPHNKFASTEFNNVREWIVKTCRVLGVVGLGRHTFLPHTHQKASILLVQKRLEKSAAKHDEAIFFALSERDGKNSKGQIIKRAGSRANESTWNLIDHDFDEIVEEFRDFRSREQISFAG